MSRIVSAPFWRMRVSTLRRSPLHPAEPGAASTSGFISRTKKRMSRSVHRTARGSSTRRPSCPRTAPGADPPGDIPGCACRGSGDGSARPRGSCRSAHSPGVRPPPVWPPGRRRTALPGRAFARAARCGARGTGSASIDDEELRAHSGRRAVRIRAVGDLIAVAAIVHFRPSASSVSRRPWMQKITWPFSHQ